MIEPLILPDSCNCCSTSSSSSSSSSSSGCCSLQGTEDPEGNVVADIGYTYRRIVDGQYYDIYYKKANNGSAFGWQLEVQLSP